ncbi:hypothetical protein OMR07_00295 [Methylobacterium organophilum]|nr:hypothetical protein [Methylobacterium organophilum]
MVRGPSLPVLGAMTLAGDVFAASSPALADPPRARGVRGFRHGGPPPWAPAHGYHRHRGFGGCGRRHVRTCEERRYGGFGGYGCGRW